MMATGGLSPQQQQQQQQSSVISQNQQRRLRPEDAANYITVSDPVQHQEGIIKYTSYRVDVRPPSMIPPDQSLFLQARSSSTTCSAVLRRYSDFLWLYERLHIERAGAIVPPLPEKQPVGRFSPAFVEDRRKSLERFLRRVAIHPELADANCFDTFLRADDVTFQAAMSAKKDTAILVSQSSMNDHSIIMQPNASPQQQQQQQQYSYSQQQQNPYNINPPQQQQNRMMNSTMMAIPQPPKKEGFKRWFAETKTSISGDLVKSPDDELFDVITRYIHGLDAQMKNVSTQASGLVRKGKEIANGLFEFGLAFNLLGQSESDLLGNALTKLGETADQLSVLSAEHAEQEVQQFEHPLLDTIKLIHAVKLALQRRHEKRLTYSTWLQEVESKQSTLAKYRAQMGMEAKAYQAEMSLRKAQENAQLARDDFAATSQRVLREVDRFKREKAEEMRRTVLDYIRLQVEYNKRMEQLWATVIPQLERVQLDQQQQQQQQSSSNVSSTAPDSSSPQLPQQQQHQQPQIHSQPMISPNPQQAMQPQPNPFYQQQQQPPQQQQSDMLSVQYRDPSSGM